MTQDELKLVTTVAEECAVVIHRHRLTDKQIGAVVAQMLGTLIGMWPKHLRQDACEAVTKDALVLAGMIDHAKATVPVVIQQQIVAEMKARAGRPQ